MNLFILDKEPAVSAMKFYNKVNPKYAFKMLIELCQLICSAGYSSVYKKIPQGKELQKWITQHEKYSYSYTYVLFSYCVNSNLDISIQTKKNICNILYDLGQAAFLIKRIQEEVPLRAYFRYKKGYDNTLYPSKTLLPIEECIIEYEKYLDWKNNK